MNTTQLSAEEKKKLIDQLDLTDLGTHPYSVEIDFDFYGTTLNIIRKTNWGIEKITGLTIKSQDVIPYAVTFIRDTVKKLLTLSNENEH